MTAPQNHEEEARRATDALHIWLQSIKVGCGHKIFHDDADRISEKAKELFVTALSAAHAAGFREGVEKATEKISKWPWESIAEEAEEIRRSLLRPEGEKP